MLTSVLALFCKEYCAQKWYDFRDPKVFYETLIDEQVN